MSSVPRDRGSPLLRHALWLSTLAFGLHYFWENAQCTLFFIHGRGEATQLAMLRAAAGDVALTWIAQVAVALVSRRWLWMLDRPESTRPRSAPIGEIAMPRPVLLCFLAAILASVLQTALAQAQGELQRGLEVDGLGSEGGLTAEGAALRARARAPSLVAARAAEGQARAQAERIGLGVWPGLDLSARYTRFSAIDNPGLVPGSSAEERAAAAQLVAGVDDPEARQLHDAALRQQLALEDFRLPFFEDQYALQATFTWPVSDVFLSVLPAYEAALGAAEAQRLRVESRAEDVDLTARVALYEYARALALREVARASVEQAEAHVAHLEALVELEAVPEVELARVRGREATARRALARAQAAVEAGGGALRTLLGMSQDEPLLLGEPLVGVPGELQTSEEELATRGLERRLEMRALRALERSQLGQVRVEERGVWPHLGLVAHADLASPHW